MTAAASEMWRATGRLVWRVIDGTALVYSDASGDTHMLDDMAAAILRCIERRPCGRAEIEAAVAELRPGAPAGELYYVAEKVLGEFTGSGLIERCN